MAHSELLVRIDGGVALLTLNRPQKRNALNRDLMAALRRGIEEAAARSDLRLLVLAAEGPVFCAGMDLAEMQQTAGSADAAAVWCADTQAYRDVVGLLFELRVPTVAVVQGAAVAGGLGLVLACDMTITSETAVFSLPEPKRGLTAAIVTPLLVFRAGVGNASYVLLSGKNLDAATALRMGICQEVVPAAILRDAANALVNSILTGSPRSLAVSKEQRNACVVADVAEQLDRAIEASAHARESEDAAEGRRAFLEKRNPAWQPERRDWL